MKEENKFGIYEFKNILEVYNWGLLRYWVYWVQKRQTRKFNKIRKDLELY